MKCRYKEEMDYFYLTRNNYKDFLDRVYGVRNYAIEEKHNNYIKVKWCSCFSSFVYFGQYYVHEPTDYNWEWFHYKKEEFEEKFEIIGEEIKNENGL